MVGNCYTVYNNVPNVNRSQLRSDIRNNDVYFSAVSIWEIASKRSLRPEGMPISAKQAVAMFHDAGYEELAVTADHAALVETLPAIHADPFDRLLVAQAMAEPMRLMTHDRVISAYSDSIMLV